MLNSDHFGLDPRNNTGQAPKSVAPSRHTLSKHRYLEHKRIRLDAEADERRRIAAERIATMASACLCWMLKASRNLVHVVRIRWGAKGV